MKEMLFIEQLTKLFVNQTIQELKLESKNPRVSIKKLSIKSYENGNTRFRKS
jgi:hypothetical protein